MDTTGEKCPIKPHFRGKKGRAHVAQQQVKSGLYPCLVPYIARTFMATHHRSATARPNTFNMAENENTHASFEEDDHRVSLLIQPLLRNITDANSAQQTAFLFNGAGAATATAAESTTKQTARPAKRRKVARPDADALKSQQATTTTTTAGPAFPALFNGAEGPGAVRLRRELFETAWPVLEGRIQVSEPARTGWF